MTVAGPETFKRSSHGPILSPNGWRRKHKEAPRGTDAGAPGSADGSGCGAPEVVQGIKTGHGSQRPSPLPLSRGERGDDAALQFVLVCVVVGLLLTLSVEFVYLVDIFRVRMNTVFKFYFQAWVLMAVGSAYVVYWLSRQRGMLRSVVLAVFWLLFGLGMVFPLIANVSRAGSFDHAPTLDGTAYLAESQPGDYAAIRWLNEQVPWAPVILEAPGSGGSSYVYEGRVAALTGLPTLLGWGGHETQWRGDSSVQSARDPDIKRIFTTLDAGEAAELLDRYGVTFVYVGPLERSTYDPRGLEKFGRFMDVVYEQDGVTIYRVRD
jgi:YYY domain-containing protein